MKKYADVALTQTATGLTQPLAGASVQVIIHSNQLNATIYSDDGVTTTANPLTTDSLGRYQFYVANGRYDLKISATGFTTFTLTDVDIHDETDTAVAGETPLPGNLIFTGNNSHSGTETYSVQVVHTPATNQFLVGASPNQTTVNFPAPSGNVTLSFPVTTDTVVARATTDTLTNKTLTSPIIATIVNTGTLTLPTSTDTLVGRATSDTLTNKTLTAPVISTISNTGTLTLPTSTDTLVGRATTDTLTNKTLSSGNILGNFTLDAVYGVYRLAADQTITAGGSLTAIPGLNWTMPANAAINVVFSCHLLYSQATAAASDQFGIQDVTVAPTNIMAKAQAYTSTSVFVAGNVPTLSTTTATSIITFTPSAATTVFNADIDGVVEQPSNASTSVIQIMAQFTTNNGTIKRGSFCTVW